LQKFLLKKVFVPVFDIFSPYLLYQYLAFLWLFSENQEDCRSVLAGGTIRGWTPDVTVVLWRRMLGSLGDINEIKDPAIHASVYEYLCELMDILIKVG
jgi:hypothetical protein